MSQAIIFTENETVKVFYTSASMLAKGVEAMMARVSIVAAEGTTLRATDISNIPQDREFRGAWTDQNPGETVDINMPKARDIHMDRIRRDRDGRWADFDSRYSAAQRDSQDLTALDAERQGLKDAPNNAQTNVDAAADVTALKAVWPAELA